jgi:hypothetical protein
MSIIGPPVGLRGVLSLLCLLTLPLGYLGALLAPLALPLRRCILFRCSIFDFCGPLATPKSFRFLRGFGRSFFVSANFALYLMSSAGFRATHRNTPPCMSASRIRIGHGAEGYERDTFGPARQLNLVFEDSVGVVGNILHRGVGYTGGLSY